MKIYIPKAEEKVKLTKDWQIAIDVIYDHKALLQRTRGNDGLPIWDNTKQRSVDYVMPEGTILQFVKIEENKNRDLSYVQMRIINSPNSELVRRPKATPRLIVSLSEANKIEFEKVEDE